MMNDISIINTNYDDFVNMSIQKIDVYGFGTALKYVYVHTNKYYTTDYGKIFMTKIYHLCKDMINENVYDRMDIKYARDKYNDALTEYNDAIGSGGGAYRRKSSRRNYTNKRRIRR
jgi:hypothetical protein